ncbi:Exodeoxyribonuclease VII large subunit [Ectothiorhodosinus mongolicus]|uniref:Exodeoxyribonuclease 7 large subunit n=1 Tax=Ectothiorhodosinus mongolicus TaxID=233100 RepID=A0A1R3VN95_9GAMM|nr:exodeoxyribonuclease VII large subunit [Ectothiorhodosinus mongolicus]ULX56477.1 exodeoxyribonuclease VII large subunit [Ectothiorhodosinus mongolicus]SIT66062.1 Exodeoxyribonuclease VII large subunit [Ectothiorhodosinus mongolicus]
MPKPEEVFSVSGLNQSVQRMIEGAFPRIWVEGEISNLARPASGHLYFSLKDAQAQVRCALFRSAAQRLGFRPQDGMQVLARAKVSLYSARGDYQLIVDHVEEAGDGALRRAFDALRKRLEGEGLFDPALKRPIPRLPRRIGVITSPSGAVIRDIVSVLKRRFPALPILLFPVPVQGAEAAPAIVRALDQAGRQGGCDVVIVARGGGSLEDLWAFNEESVARAIRACALPVISAVGHETDVTIADFAADLRAPTPSAAAELVSPDAVSLQVVLTRQKGLLLERMRTQLNQRQQMLDSLNRQLRQQHPQRQLAERSQRLDDWDQRLQLAWQRRFEKNQDRVAHLAQQLQMVSPLATLSRGYSIVQNAQGEAIRSPSQVQTGEMLTARLAEGEIRCEVKS